MENSFCVSLCDAIVITKYVCFFFCTTQTWIFIICSVFNRLGRGASEQSEHPAPHLPRPIPTRQCDARRWAALPHSSLPLSTSHHTCSVSLDLLNHSSQSRIMGLTDKKLLVFFLLPGKASGLIMAQIFILALS